MTRKRFRKLSRVRFAHAVAFGLISLALSPTLIAAQLSEGTVRDVGGPLSDLSTNVGDNSGPVYQPGSSITEGNASRLSGNPVRGSVSADLVSGPVSDISVGPVTANLPVTGGGPVEASSAGSVKKDIASPLGEMISEPLHDLGLLQQELRAIQPLPRNTPLPSDIAAQQAASEEVTTASDAATEAEEEPTAQPVLLAEPEENPVEEPEASAPNPEAEPPTPNEPPAEDTDEAVAPQPPEPAEPEPESAEENAPAAEEKADEASEPPVTETPPQPEAVPNP